MKGHAEVIAAEVERMVAAWNGTAQTIDLLDFFAELTIYTSSACLIGKKFREELDDRFAQLYHDLERGTDALAYVDPYAPIDSFRRRDEARVELVKLVEAIMAKRTPETPADENDRDLLDLLMSVKDGDDSAFSADEITGMFIGTMFAGHHTTSGTAAWTLIELLRHPEEMAAVVDELDALYADGSEVSFQALREIPRLESAIKEALRLHPPLILLLRVATEDLEVGGYQIRGATSLPRVPQCRTGSSLTSRTRMLRPAALPRPATRGRSQPLDLDPVRRRQAPVCRRGVRGDAAEGNLLGAAARLHVRACAALGDLPQRPLEDGRPARAAVRGHRDTARVVDMRIVVDRDLCQGHAMCEVEAPAVFATPKVGTVELLVERPPADQVDAVRAAIQYCPTRALSIEED